MRTAYWMCCLRASHGAAERGQLGLQSSLGLNGAAGPSSRWLAHMAGRWVLAVGFSPQDCLKCLHSMGLGDVPWVLQYNGWLESSYSMVAGFLPRKQSSRDQGRNVTPCHDLASLVWRFPCSLLVSPDSQWEGPPQGMNTRRGGSLACRLASSLPPEACQLTGEKEGDPS